MMNYSFISTECRGSVAIVTLKRIENLNAVNLQMLSEIADALVKFDKDDAIGAMLLCGSDKAFAAGIDVNELTNQAQNAVAYDQEMFEAFMRIRSCKKPIVAAVAGYVLGIGLQLALCGDIILAADNARFGQPEVSLGVIPGFGAATNLTATIGKPKAAEMILTGRALNAEDALNAGLISRIVPLSDVFDEGVRTAMRIAAQPRIAVLAAKEALKAAACQDGDSALALENKLLHLCMLSDDFRESLLAFAEKRAPNLKNRF